MMTLLIFTLVMKLVRIIVENDFSNFHEEILIFNKKNLKNISISDSSEYKKLFH